MEITAGSCDSWFESSIVDTKWYNWNEEIFWNAITYLPMCLYLSGNLRRYIYVPKIQNLKTVITTKNMLLGSILSSDMDSTYLKTPISIFCLLFYHDIFAIFTSFAHPKIRDGDRLLIVPWRSRRRPSPTLIQLTSWEPGSLHNQPRKLRWSSACSSCPYCSQSGCRSSIQCYNNGDYNGHCCGNCFYCGLWCIIFSPKITKWERS